MSNDLSKEKRISFRHRSAAPRLGFLPAHSAVFILIQYLDPKSIEKLSVLILRGSDWDTPELSK